MRKPENRQAPLSEQECERVLAQCKTSEFSGLRDLTFLALIMDTLIPPSEANRIRVSDVDTVKSVVTASGLSTGNCPMSAPMTTLMHRYLLARGARRPSTDTLFVTLSGKPVPEYFFNVALRGYAKSAQIRRHYPCTLNLWHYSAVMHVLQVGLPSLSTRLVAPRPKIDAYQLSKQGSIPLTTNGICTLGANFFLYGC